MIRLLLLRVRVRVRVGVELRLRLSIRWMSIYRLVLGLCKTSSARSASGGMCSETV